MLGGPRNLQTEEFGRREFSQLAVCSSPASSLAGLLEATPDHTLPIESCDPWRCLPSFCARSGLCGSLSITFTRSKLHFPLWFQKKDVGIPRNDWDSLRLPQETRTSLRFASRQPAPREAATGPGATPAKEAGAPALTSAPGSLGRTEPSSTTQSCAQLFPRILREAGFLGDRKS